MSKPTDLVPAASAATLARAEDLLESARGYAAESRSANTRRSYQRAWGRFESFAEGLGAEALPAQPATVAAYLASLADQGLKTATISLATASIAAGHRAAGLNTPTTDIAVKTTLAGIRRKLGTTQRQVAPATTDVLGRLLGTLPDSLRGLRDRALLLVGFAAALRRSELAALDVGDVAFSEDGICLTIRSSKTDQEGAGAEVGIPYGSRKETCPVRSLRKWIDAAGLTEGALFLSVSRHGQIGQRIGAQDVARIIKRVASNAGLDPAELSGHSLRSGLVTSAAKAGKSLDTIMSQSRHKSVAMARRYIRRANLFDDNAAAGLL